jgi:hypothetical protein
LRFKNVRAIRSEVVHGRLKEYVLVDPRTNTSVC